MVLTAEQRERMEKSKQAAALRRKVKESHAPSSLPSHSQATHSANQPRSNSDTNPSTSSFNPRTNQPNVLQPSSNFPPPLNNNNRVKSQPNIVSNYWTPAKMITTKITCNLVSRDRFEAIPEPHRDKFFNVCTAFRSRRYDQTNRSNTFSLKDYKAFVSKCREVFAGEKLDLIELSDQVKRVFSKPINGKELNPRMLENLGPKGFDQQLYNSLFPFQRDGVNFIICKSGRALLADDMGLGKTLQALAVMSYYRKEWPCLVVCPSSLRFVWKHAIEQWLKESPLEITVLEKASDPLPFLQNNNVIVVTSYDLMTRKQQQLEDARFRVIVLDESHSVKDREAKRTKAAKSITSKSQRLLLLTGTPALSRPSELYTQIAMINKSCFKDFTDFGKRYCDGKHVQYGKKTVFEALGATNTHELRLILEETIMIRRLKSSVLSQLPSKSREMILLDSSAVKTNLERLQHAKKILENNALKGHQLRGAILEYFHETAEAKVDAVKNYVNDLLDRDTKFILFAHHKSMIEQICWTLTTKGVSFICIDGSTSSCRRGELVSKFQTSDNCRVAVLSITVGSTGLTLTAASLVIFAELFWNPGILVQAEDRAHRVGQQDNVLIQYLVAKGTADDTIWHLVRNKLGVLNSVGLSKDNFNDATTTKLCTSEDNSAVNTLYKYLETSMMDQVPEDDLQPSSSQPAAKKMKF